MIAKRRIVGGNTDNKPWKQILVLNLILIKQNQFVPIALRLGVVSVLHVIFSARQLKIHRLFRIFTLNKDFEIFNFGKCIL